MPMENIFKFDLGDSVCDGVTGFEGIVTARAQYVSGLVQYEVEPPVDKDGDMRGSAWISEVRLN